MARLEEYEKIKQQYKLKRLYTHYKINDILYNASTDKIMTIKTMKAPIFTGKTIEEYIEFKKDFVGFLQIFEPKKEAQKHYCYSYVEIAKEIIRKANLHFIKNNEIEEMEDEERFLLSEAIHGGMRHSDKTIDDTNFKYYDINSSYPYALLNLPMIFKSPIKQSLEFVKNFDITKAKNIFGLYSIDIFQSSEFPYYKNSGIYTHFHLLGFNNIGITYKINMIWLYEEAKATNELTKTIETLYDMKKNNIFKTTAKLVLNCLYGSCVKMNTYSILTNDYDPAKHALVSFTPEKCEVLNEGDEIFKFPAFGRMHPFILGFGMHQLTLYIKMALKNNCLISYINTDALKTNYIIDEKYIGLEIGQLKIEVGK